MTDIQFSEPDINNLKVVHTFCTIVTKDYLHFALALRDSLLSFSREIELFILLADGETNLKALIESRFPNTYLVSPSDVCETGLGKAIYDKYASNYIDGFRWSMKPVFLDFLIRKFKVNKIAYVDCDIQFYSDFSFLFKMLDTQNVLLSPHWRSSDPYIDQSNFELLYTSGLYNAGFIAVNQNALTALEWWAKANLFICEVNPSKGQFVDQTHLNLLQVYFEGVTSLKHRGCNIAAWNLIECKRVVQNDTSVLINGLWPIVFIHFTKSTIKEITDGIDAALKPYLEIYRSRVFALMGELTALGMYCSPLHSENDIRLEDRERQPSLMTRLNKKLRSTFKI